MINRLLKAWLPALLFFSTNAMAEPEQEFSLYFETGRQITTHAFNGQSFDSGFTFSGWFKLDAIPELEHVSILGQEYNFDDFLVTYNDGFLVVFVENYSVPMSTPLVFGEWMHIAVTFSDTELVLYVNGALDTKLSIDTPKALTFSEQGSFKIGGDVPLSSGFHGQVKQVKVWSASLSAQQIETEADSD